MPPSDVFCPKSKDNQFAVIEEDGNLNIFALKDVNHINYKKQLKNFLFLIAALTACLQYTAHKKVGVGQMTSTVIYVTL